MGEIIMGTDGTIEITVGDGPNTTSRRARRRSRGGIASLPRPWRQRPARQKKKKAFVAGATMVAGGGANGPIPIMTSDLDFTGKESFFDQEVKFARRWLTTKGVMVQEEQRNPVDVELESFFRTAADRQEARRPIWKSAWRIRWR